MSVRQTEYPKPAKFRIVLNPFSYGSYVYLKYLEQKITSGSFRALPLLEVMKKYLLAELEGN